jgi:hypothetical protein
MGLVSSIAIMAALPVMAQTTNSNSNANSSSGAASSSRSGAISTSRGGSATGNQNTSTQGVASTTNTGVTLNQTSNTSPNTSANNTDRLAGGTSNTNQNTNSGYTSSDNIVRTTPTVYAPPVSGGNPCTLAVSGGVSVIGWGAAAGGTFVDQDCANRQKIAMVWNSGLKDIAFELMCNDRDTYNAAKSTAAGPRCAFRQQFEAPGAVQQPVVQPQPVPLGPQPTVQRTTSTQPFQPSGRFACMNAMGREVPSGTPGASCGYI